MKNLLRIVQIGPYSIDQPTHGGQIRVSELNHKMSTFAAALTYFSIAVGARSSSDSGNHITVAHDAADMDHRFPFLSDYFSGLHVYNDERLFAGFRKRLSDFKPTVICLEQCWAWPAVKRWLGEQASACIVCYSSQNIEYLLKADLHRAPGAWHDGAVNEGALADYISKIKYLEFDLIRSADVCIAVSRTDADAMSSAGAKQVIVAPNGVTERTVDRGRQEDWRQHFSNQRFSAFVGSGHPPNASGFWQCTEAKLGFLRPDELILAIGSVCSLLRNSEEFRSLGPLGESRLRLAGVIAENDLVALLSLANAIILPIKTGGGTNLKTAEALATQLPVVATSEALRGYEFAANYPTVLVANDAESFVAALGGFLKCR